MASLNFHYFASLMTRFPKTVTWVRAFTNELRYTTQSLPQVTPNYPSLWDDPSVCCKYVFLSLVDNKAFLAFGKAR